VCCGAISNAARIESARAQAALNSRESLLSRRPLCACVLATPHRARDTCALGTRTFPDEAPPPLPEESACLGRVCVFGSRVAPTLRPPCTHVAPAHRCYPGCMPTQLYDDHGNQFVPAWCDEEPNGIKGVWCATRDRVIV
jgi:hypothetical protein